MGAPKGLLRTREGQPLAIHLAQQMRDAGLVPVLVGRRPEYGALGLDVLDDAPSARGPMAGLLALLEAAHGEPAVAVACDMPFVSAELLRKLASAKPAPIVAARRSVWEPLFARYDAACVLGVARARAGREQFSLQGLFDSLDARALELDANELAQLTDWDTQQDVAENPTLARATAERTVHRWTVAGTSDEQDRVAVEEPLEIRVGRDPIAVTMRTPGADVDLAVGFLLGEGVVRSRRDVLSVAPEGPSSVSIDLSADARARLGDGARRWRVTSSCGVCGKESVSRVRAHIEPIAHAAVLSADVIRRMPNELRAHQALFDRTGGLHAAGLFGADGTLLRVAEDVGRHNAVDKVLGAELLADHLPASNAVLALSGRVAFELVQKAALAGVSAVVAVGAPTSLAVELAQDVGIVLIGFTRDDRFNVYTRGASVVP